MKIKTPDQLFNKLFFALNSSGNWSDDKTIADAIPKAIPSVIMSAYREKSIRKNFDLIAFAHRYFEFPAPLASDFQSNTSQSPHEHIKRLWEVLERKADKATKGSSLLPLPHPYIVPGGRFNEIYYWDSYFTMLGLKLSGKMKIVQSMVDNFSHLIQTIGYIPNGNRTYFVGRSQPPFYALMVDLLTDTQGQDAYLNYLEPLEKEYRFWMKGDRAFKRGAMVSNRVVRFQNNFQLNRHWDNNDKPRAEMHSTDQALAQSTNRNEKELFRDMRAACESGWDFSSRWLRDANDLTTIRTTELLPVDLNSLLYNLECALAKAYQRAGVHKTVEYYQQKAEIRYTLIQNNFWNAGVGFFCDYDMNSNAPSSMLTLAGMFPLFFEIATPEQAAQSASLIQEQFLHAGGLTATTTTTEQQWDAPNGWAPLHWIAVKGLLNYGYKELAHTIAERWCALNTKIFKSTGKMLEKYNVVNTDLATGGGEYPVQDGFGWTNGVWLQLMEVLEH